jgi:uncharacterized protein YkwD
MEDLHYSLLISSVNFPLPLSGLRIFFVLVAYRYVTMKFDVSHYSLLFLITTVSSCLAGEQEGDSSSRSAAFALTTTQIGLSIPSVVSQRAGHDGEIGDKEDDTAPRAPLATLTITADLQPTLLAAPQPPNPGALGLIGNINLSKLIGSASSSFLNDNEFQSAVLNSTNTIRQQHNATALAWNSTLVSYAQNWSERCRPKKSVSIPQQNQHMKQDIC